jgi:uncharacterized protein YvpB
MDKILIITFVIIIIIIFSLKPLIASPFCRSDLILMDSYDDFSRGNFERTISVNDTEGFIKISPNLFCSDGTYTSPVIEMDFPAEEIYPSWNINCQGGKTGFIVYIRVSQDRLNWSPWFYTGSCGKHPKIKKKMTKNSFGFVDIDYLSLKKEAEFIQYSIHLFSSKDKSVTPMVKLFSLSYGKREKKETGHVSNVTTSISSGRILSVPYRSQGDEDRTISGRICSPTSVAMVMSYWGINIATDEVAKMSYDKEHDIYGSWPLAVQAASQYGLKGWVEIFRSWDDVEKKISAGIPVIATICFEAGELKGSITDSSQGHVIVVKGFSPEGNIVCNDPAGKNEKEGIITYNRDELGKVWFKRSGIGYVIIK